MPARIPPMQALRAFEAAARSGSLTKAAEALSVTHGAISHQIKALEHIVGVPLIERAGRGIRATDDGERLATRLRAALADIADAIREAGERNNPRQLRVSVTPSFAARWLLPRLGKFIARHRDIDLDVRSSIALVDFRRDDADVAIRQGFGGWPDVHAEHILSDTYFPVCSPRLAPRLPRVPADVARYTLLRADDEWWKPWFDAVGLDWPEPSRGPIFNDSALMLQAAVEGQGIALARTSLLGNDLRNGLLVRLFDIDVPAPRRHYLVYPPRLAASPKLALFRAWLQDEIRSDEAARATPTRKRRRR
jgi:LysR family transcriptional regulator, glycine cleavage system transcriptional activator